MSIVVFGSINMDLVAHTPRLPEAASLTGTAISSIEDAALAAGKLLSSGVRRVIVKMGSQGALAVTKSGA